jgi:hypothetical protein
VVVVTTGCSSLAATGERLRDWPACAVAEANTIAVIRKNLRM